MDDFDLVIFDCDGVLIDSELISAHQLVSVLRGQRVEIDLAYVARHFLGRSYPVVLSQIRRDFGVALPDGFDADYRRQLLAAFETELKIMPHVAGVIDGLGVPYCLATSSSPPRLQRSLEIVGLTERFRGLTTTASEVEHGKPAPDLFLLAAAKMGADPARCLVIEDSLNGIRAGLAAGMTVWRFTGGAHLKDQASGAADDVQAHGEFASFADFFKLMPNLCKDE